MAGEQILIVDDEANIRDLAGMYLEQAGFAVKTVANGAEALQSYAAEEPELVVLDLMMPEMDGWEVCRQLRARGDVPIIMLTARDDDIDKIVGLEMGADDYITKPFNPRELVARVRAILRRSGSSPLSDRDRSIRRLAELTINPQSQEVLIDGQRINLRSKEFDLLLTLVDHKNHVLTRDQLLDKVWGYEYYGNTRTVDVHVAHVRDKLEGTSVSIETVWGKGYKLVVN
ncbi:MAG: response regulator transcription factor [Ardenticatenaceae bacterium]|nr:response regulator transcription factor [Ardenticatenaceae bacterium]